MCQREPSLLPCRSLPIDTRCCPAAPLLPRCSRPPLFALLSLPAIKTVPAAERPPQCHQPPTLPLCHPHLSLPSPQSNTDFIQRMVAIKATEDPNKIILPKSAQVGGTGVSLPCLGT